MAKNMIQQTTTLNERDVVYLRAICDASLYHFIKIIGGYANQGGDISSIIHRQLCDFSQNPAIKRKVIATPRNWRKSTCFSKWRAIWKYLKNNETRMLIASENMDIGTRFLDFMERQILNNALLKMVYPELREIDSTWTKKHRWSGSQAELPRKGIYSEATFTVIGVRGAAQSGHYTDIEIDDLVGDDAMTSLAVMEAIYRWFDNVPELLLSADPSVPDASEVSIVGTFWSTADFLSYVRDKYPEYQFLIVPALKDETAIDTENVKYIQHPQQGHWETNFPEHPDFSTQYYIDMQANPEKELIFWSQHQNNPHMATALEKFDSNWFRYCHTEIREEEIFS
jgi:hypothetical protein